MPRLLQFVGVIRRALDAAARLAPRRVRPTDRGEQAAARLLQRAGWEVLAANLIIGDDEADLVCRDPRGAPVLVEVKSSRGGPVPAELRVGSRKQAALRRLALRLGRERSFAFAAPPRIDVVVIRLGQRACDDRIARHLVAAVSDGARCVVPRGGHFAR